MISLVLHAGLAGSGMLRFGPAPEDEPFEVAFEIEEEVLPQRYEIEEEKKIEPPAAERQEILEPVVDESVTEQEPEPEPENEILQKSLLRYQDSIKQKIQQEKQYPRWALRSSHEGSARISFLVLPSGQVRDLRLLYSSGFPELDKEALSAVTRAGPFEVFPSEFRYETIQVEVDIFFKIAFKKDKTGQRSRS